jgi:hypothetical protein
MFMDGESFVEENASLTERDLSLRSILPCSTFVFTQNAAIPLNH